MDGRKYLFLYQIFFIMGMFICQLTLFFKNLNDSFIVYRVWVKYEGGNGIE